MPTIFSGDTWPLKVSVTEDDGTKFIINSTDTVKAVFVDIKTKTEITTEIDCVSTTLDADWANGIVAITPVALESVKLNDYDGKDVLLAVQVERTLVGNREWQFKYRIKKGYIT